MFEICALLASKKAPVARKARGPSIKPGVRCKVWGRDATVVGRHETNPRWWNVRVDGMPADRVSGFNRSEIDIV